ncbi:MAG: glycosyltransferase family 1 protein [Candidatus Electrothrix sp. AW1]|nr:glycosyltransferase family 1 protein [Candidatus Electrothrix sp. AX1]MCI5181666.1 glycosyltransferase family 1 protein [Candidatus Electrothrix gigas]
MKIVFDHQAFTKQSYGGISRYFVQLAKELIKHDQNVKIFAGIHQNHYLPSLPSDIISGLNIKKYPPKTIIIFQYINCILNIKKIERAKADIVHETYYSVINSKSKTVPRVITVYDMIHELYQDMFSKYDPVRYWKRNAIERADHIISISMNTKNDLINIVGVKPEKVTTVHLGVDNWSLSKKSEERLEEDTKPFLLYVGQRGGYKNFYSLLKAVSLSRKLKDNFDIIAFGGGRFTKKEKKIIADFSYDNQQVEQVSGSDDLLAGLYRRARAFVYPSLYEGFGIPPLEAMACHCPVVSSNTSSMPEVIGDAGEFFDPNSLEAMIAAIKNVVFSKSRIQELQRKGQDRLKFFSWEKCAKETLEVYKKVVG